MKTIQQEWLEYRTACISPKAGVEQLMQTKQAFYSGVMIMLNIVQSAPDDDESIRGMMSSINQDLKIFEQELNLSLKIQELYALKNAKTGKEVN